MKEWGVLLLAARPWVAFLGRVVPDFFLVVDKVVIGFANIGAEVSVVAKDGGPGFDAFREVCHGGFAVILSAEPGGKDAGGEGGAGHGTNRGIGESVVENNPLGGQFINVGSVPVFGSVEFQVVDGIVLGYQK